MPGSYQLQSKTAAEMLENAISRAISMKSLADSLQRLLSHAQVDRAPVETFFEMYSTRKADMQYGYRLALLESLANMRGG